MSATLNREADRWFISIPVEIGRPEPGCESQATGGVDLGVSTAVTVSTGEKSDSPKSLKCYRRRLQRLARWHSRKQKGSVTRRKSTRKLAKLHARISHIRQDWLHQVTTDLARRFAVIGIEDLNVRGMLANDKLARSIHDIGFYEFRRQLKYKAALNGGLVVVVGEHAKPGELGSLFKIFHASRTKTWIPLPKCLFQFPVEHLRAHLQE